MDFAEGECAVTTLSMCLGEEGGREGGREGRREGGREGGREARQSGERSVHDKAKDITWFGCRGGCFLWSQLDPHLSISRMSSSTLMA